MSQVQIEIAERFYAALDARDLDALTAVLTEDVVFNAPLAIPFGGRLVGRDAVRGFITDAWGFVDGYENVRERMVAHGDRVVVSGRHRGRAGSGRGRFVPYHTVLTIRDRLIGVISMQVDAGLVVKAVAAELAAPDEAMG
jgi:ketosteroid isomerase-like protein